MKRNSFALALLAATPAYGQIWSDPWAFTDYSVHFLMGAYSNMIEKGYGDDQCFVGLWNTAFGSSQRSQLFDGSKDTENWFQEGLFWLFAGLETAAGVSSVQACFAQLAGEEVGENDFDIDVETDIDFDGLDDIEFEIDLFKKGMNKVKSLNPVKKAILKSPMVA